MNEMIPHAQFRDITTITAEIRTIQATVRRTALEGCIEIGRRLVEAKELLPHGEWGQYLKEEFDWSQDRAGQLMKLFKEYGSSQQNLFGAELNSDTYRNLSFSQALRLIAIPESEREDFVKDNNVEQLSTRELDALIKEHERQLAAERERTSEAEAESREAHEELDKLVNKYEALSTVAREQKEELEKAKEEAAAAEKKLQELKSDPEIPQETVDKLKAEFSAAAKEAEARVAELELKLKTADPSIAVFKVHFDAVQREFSTMLSLISSTAPETGTKLRTAVAAMLEKFRKEVEE